MKKIAAAFWDNFKSGGTPLVILIIFYHVLVWAWSLVWHWGVKLPKFHIINQATANIALNLFILFTAVEIFGYIRKQEWFQDLILIFLKIPFIGPRIYKVLSVKPFVLVEVRTVWGPTPEESCWEYAILLGKEEEEFPDRKLIWSRVHTLGAGSGKFISRAGSKNIRHLSEEEQKKALSLVLSFGFDDSSYNKKSVS